MCSAWPNWPEHGYGAEKVADGKLQAHDARVLLVLLLLPQAVRKDADGELEYVF